MITAIEKGRKLVITVGDEEDNLVITVPPVNSAKGAALLALWAGVIFGQSKQMEQDATSMSQIAVGEGNWSTIEDELRSAEANLVINAAVFWNIQGGGIELVNEMLRDGLPKAQASLADANGFGRELSQLRTLLNGVSENPTLAPADTPATTTPVGTSGSFGETTTPQSQG